MMKKLASRFHEFQTVRLRVKALIIKEILAVLRDKKSRFMLILPPLVQLIILSHAATLDVMNISLAVYNQDSGWYSHELVQRIKGSPYFLHVYEYKNPQEAKRAIDTQKVIVSLNFQSNFSRLVAGGQSAPLQVVLDGRK
jgi:ABC-2 type transport system permease protein